MLENREWMDPTASDQIPVGRGAFLLLEERVVRGLGHRRTQVGRGNVDFAMVEFKAEVWAGMVSVG